MDHDVLKTVFYAGIKDLLKNSRYFYHSPIGAQYCHLTDAGEKAILDYIKIMSPLIHEAEQKAFDQRAREIVMQTLKGENND